MKLVVLFPGVGYHNDKPLMYYTKRIARKYDYEMVELSFVFSGVTFTKGDKEKTNKAIDVAFQQAREKLKDVRFDEYDRVIFVGKSLGTAVMTKYSAEYCPAAEMIVFTPIAETFDYIETHGSTHDLVFHGSADPLLDTELCVRLCEEKSLAYTVIPEGNHSLETGNVETDIRNLGNVMRTVMGRLQSR